MSCKLNNIPSNCELIVSGIQRLWLIPYGDVTNLRYNPNNLSFITDYQLLSIPIEWNTGRDTRFTSNLNYNDKIQTFTHSLEVQLIKLEPFKREEIEKIRRQDWSAIFSDMTKQCRFLGESSPLRLKSIDEVTGSRNEGSYEYRLRFETIAQHQAKFINCFDAECFSSFIGEESRRSVFLINNASTLVSTGSLQIVADTDLLTSSGTITPTGWNNPLVVNTDVQTLNSLLGGRGVVEALQYNSVSDLALISLASFDTTFDYFKGFTANPIRSIRTRFLELSILTGTIANGSTITVTDSFNNVLYSGLISDPISGLGLSGTVGNATIEVSTLYSTSVTFTATITGTSCETRQYTYNYEPLTTCDTTFDYQVLEGTQYSVTFSKYDFAPSFRRMSLHYGGFSSIILGNASEYTSDLATFQTAVVNAITNWGSDISINTIQVIDGGSVVTILFQSSNPNSYFHVILYGNDFGSYTNDVRYVAGTKSVLLNLITTTAQSDISIRQSSSLIEGLNGQPPTTVNGFLLETVNGVQNTTNNVNIVLNPFPETAQFEIDVTSSSCPTYSHLQDIVTCVTETTSRNGGVYYILEYPVVSSAEIGFSFWEIYNGATPLGSFFMSQVNPNNYAQLAFNLNDFGFELLNAQFSWAQSLWIIELRHNVEYSALRINIDGAPAFTISRSFSIADCNFDDVLHPSITVDYNLPTIDPALPTLNVVNQRADSPVYYFMRDQYQIAYLDYDTGTGDLDITINNSSGITGDFYFDLYNTFPTPTVTPMITYQVNAGNTNATFNYLTDLALVGYVPTDTAYVVVRNDNGFYHNKLYVIATNTAVSIDEVILYRSIWGRGQQFWALTSDWSAYYYTWSINSLLCPLFSPLRLNSDLLLWVRPEGQTISWRTTTTRTLTNGSLTYTGSSSLEVNALVSFDAGVTYYIVTNVSGSTITLNRPISEPSGPHMEFVAVVDNLTDSSTYNRTGLGHGNTRYYLTNVNGGFSGIYINSSSYYSLNPITVSNPNSLDMFTVVRSASGSASILFAHRSSTNALVQFNVNPTTWCAVGQFRDSNGINLQTATSTVNAQPFPIFNLYSYSFVQGVSPSPDNIQVWNNGDYNNRASASTNMTGTFTSSQQLIGAFNIGSVQPGFAGIIQEIIITNGLSLADKQKVEGWIAWKYGMQSFLPNYHPYKNVRP
jgi:hypothetical protein